MTLQLSTDQVWEAIEKEQFAMEDYVAGACLIEVTPVGEFVTYGVGVSLLQMRNPEQARGRAPVGALA